MVIHRPALLLNRDNDERIGEKIAAHIPFISKIESSDVGLVMLNHAIASGLNKSAVKTEQLFSNDDLKNMARDFKAQH